MRRRKTILKIKSLQNIKEINKIDIKKVILFTTGDCLLLSKRHKITLN